MTKGLIGKYYQTGLPSGRAYRRWRPIAMAPCDPSQVTISAWDFQSSGWKDCIFQLASRRYNRQWRLIANGFHNPSWTTTNRGCPFYSRWGAFNVQWSYRWEAYFKCHDPSWATTHHQLTVLKISCFAYLNSGFVWGWLELLKWKNLRKKSENPKLSYSLSL